MYIKTLNNVIACKPFEKRSIETKQTGSMVLVDQKISLTKLEVVFPDNNEDFKKGDFVFVRGDQYVQTWAKEILNIEGTQCILVPVSAIYVVVNKLDPGYSITG